jgi:outer membrane protein TolC
MAEIDVVQAEAEAATRRQTVAQAEATWRTAELSLKRLIVGSTEDPLWRARIDPTDRPSFNPAPVDVEAAVRRALDQRTDLVQSRKVLESTDTNLRFLRNQSLPGVDLVASYGLQGIGGTSFIRAGGLGSPIVQTIPGGYADALTRIRDREFPNWNLAVNLNYPIGTSAADANYARARVERNQSLAQIRALELQVATEVTNAALQLESNLKSLEAATAARELAERRLEAEQSKFEVGISTNFFVVQAQRDLSDAQNAELRTLADYRKSLVEFERVQEAGGAGGGAGGGAR